VRIFFENLLQHLMEIPTGLLVGDRFWAFIRLMIVLAILFGFMCLGGIIFEQQALDITISAWITEDSSVKDIPHWLLELGALFSTWKSWRYLIMPLASLVGAILLGARYIQEIYFLKSFRKVLHYFIASMFDIFYPSVVIEDGKFKLKAGEENVVVSIGGPGNVVIRPGSVALFENTHNPTNTRAEGVHFLTRYEKIREKGSLEEQHGRIEQLASVTKDGVRVFARDIHFRYRILPNRHLRINDNLAEQEPPPQEDPQSEYSIYRHALRGGRTPWVPYPYSIQAIRNMTYNRIVDSKGVVSWADTVRRQFEGEIRNYIRRNNLDQITAPRAFDHLENGWELRQPRQDIHRNYKDPSFRSRFREVGAELLWYGIGYFEVADSRVNDQRVDTWRAAWQGDTRKKRAYSEARRLAYEEQGRAEARAEVLMGIMEGLDASDLSDKQRTDRIPDLLLTQVANLLEATKKTHSTGNTG
jgi:hypothetical protein